MLVGADFNEEEKASVLSIWRYSGYLMGIPRKLRRSRDMRFPPALAKGGQVSRKKGGKLGSGGANQFMHEAGGSLMTREDVGTWSILESIMIS